MKKHLAIFSSGGARQILSGKKTIETRFSQKRIAPFGLVNLGDIVYIKPSGEDIIGQFVVKKVINYEGLDSEDLALIRNKYGKQISLGNDSEDQKYFEQRATAKYATIIFIGNVEHFIVSPINITKKDLRGWVVL